MISVVIPLYNKEQSVVATIQSVLAQTYTDYEIVVVDDGCTDASVSVVQTQMQNTDKIRLIRQKNAGVSAARNTGIRNAQGEYVAFLDADDYWEPEVLNEYVRLINDFPDATLYALGCGTMVNDVKYPCQCSVKPNYRGYLIDVWEHHPIFLSTASCCCCRTCTAIQIGGFDIRMTHGEDYDMWWRLIFVGKLAFYNQTFVYYVQDSENRAMHRMPLLEKYIPFYIDKYKEEREKNVSFRKFCDDELARRLYPYLFDSETKKIAQDLLRRIDWKLLKPSLYWRMRFPRLYALYKRC